MYWSSADFIGWFRLKGKSRKTFDIMISRKCFFFNFGFVGFGGAAARLPPSFGAPLSKSHPVSCWPAVLTYGTCLSQRQEGRLWDHPHSVLSLCGWNRHLPRRHEKLSLVVSNFVDKEIFVPPVWDLRSFFHCLNENTSVRDFRLPPPCWQDLLSFGMLHSVEWQSFPDASGKLIGPVSFLDFLTLEYGTDTLSRNVGKRLPLDRE
jgi:hypothetical protein